MEWKRRHWAGTLLLAMAPILMNIGEPLAFLAGSALGGLLTGAAVVFVISAPIQWTARKYRKRRGGDDGQVAEAAD